MSQTHGQSFGEDRPTPRIAVRNVAKTYGDTIVLERITLDVPAGAFCTIVGASG